MVENDASAPVEENLDVLEDIPSFDENDYVTLDDGRTHGSLIGDNDDVLYD